MTTEAQEVVLYMLRTGCTPSEATLHFFPGIGPDERKKLADKYRKWVQRYGPKLRGHQPAPPAPSSSPPSVVAHQEPAVRHDVAAMDAAECMAWVVAQMAGLVDASRKRGDAKSAAAAANVMLNARKELDKARERESKVKALDRTPEGLAKALNELGTTRKQMLQHAAAWRERERKL